MVGIDPGTQLVSNIGMSRAPSFSNSSRYAEPERFGLGRDTATSPCSESDEGALERLVVNPLIHRVRIGRLKSSRPVIPVISEDRGS